ncbi:MAG TPA: type II secretion system F family protein [Rhizomicrobium sp.]|nr:type II secretion system F family protein [Rhizomicrobium sp.]
MIHILSELSLAGFVVATAVMLILDRGQARHLARLDALLSPGAPGADAAPPKQSPVRLEKLLPRMFVRNLSQLGFAISPRDTVAGFAALVLFCLVVGAMAGPAAAAGIVAAAVLLTFATVNILAGRRVTKFSGQLPGFLDRLRQMLVVGSNLPTAFARAVQGSHVTTVEFLGPAVRRVHNGAGFSDSVRQCADDIGLHELQLFAATVTANARFGGSLSQALANLVLYLRRRAAIERELRASTAQIRASAWVLALLPLVVALVIMVQNRDYAAWFFTHSAGKKLLLYCLVSQVIGAVLMRLVVRTRF